MGKNKQHHRHNVLSLTKVGFIAFFIMLCVASSVARSADHYQIADGINQVINEHGTCYTVVNNTGQDLFVPTKTSAEWAQFLSSTLVSSSGITLSPCGVLCSTPSTAKTYACTGTVLGSTTVASGDISSCHTYCQTVSGATCCEVSGTACSAKDGGYTTSFGTPKAVLCSSPATSCSEGGIALADIDYTNFYFGTRACGEACSSLIQSRTCNNTVLTGSSGYSAASCPSESACADCDLDGITVPHNTSATFYSDATPACGTMCSSISQSRLCTNGVLGGSATYDQSSCTEGIGCPTCFTPWLTYGKYDCFGTLVGSTTGLTQSACLNYCEGLSGVGCCMWTTTNNTCYARQGVPTYSVSSWYITTCSTSAPVNCMLDGVTVLHGNSRTFYGLTNPSCPDHCDDIDLIRQCINGYFTGDAYYRWASCTSPIGCGASCPPVGGVTLNDGESHTFFLNAEPTCDSSCGAESLLRSCTDGVLSGGADFDQASCTEPTGCGTSCSTVDGITLNDGESHTFYSNAAPSCGSSCGVGQLRTCTEGVLSGSATYNLASCTEPTGCGASCPTVDGVTLNSGQSYTFYSTATPSCGTSCAAVGQLRTCTDGTLSGSISYNRASCSEATGCGACPAVDGITLNNGESYTFYTTTAPACGATCAGLSQLRTCTSGTLSGSASYNRASCSNPTGCSCPTVDGVTLNNGESHTFYTSSAASCGTTCSALSQLRTCTSGTLSGSASYNISSCSDPVGCCGSQSVNWFQSNLCQATTVDSVPNGEVISIVDSVGPAVGTADFTCNNGTLNLTTVICCSTSCSVE